jgi:hypothetical protein|nr:MAG TPA: hypothetical protein [Microviridae sp.]
MIEYNHRKKRKVLKMMHKYELRSWNNDDTMTTVLKITDEPKNAKKRAREYANKHKGIYSLYKVEVMEIYFTEKE